MYSTPDYEGNPNIYRWNYFYTPVQIGDTVTGVRIAVRDMAKTAESQIYHWGIKNEATLGGGGDGKTVSHTDASSAASNNNIAQPVETVNNEGGNQNGQEYVNQPVGAENLSTTQGDIGRAGVFDGEQGGTAGASAYEQVAPVAGRAGQPQRTDGRRAAFERHNRIQAIRDSVRDVIPRSPERLGIPGGEKEATLKVIPVAHQTEEMKRVDAWFAERGVSAYFFVGSLTIQKDGKQFTANGMLHGDRVFIRADSPNFTLEQIEEHEKFHLLKRENPGMVEQLMHELQEKYSAEAFAQIVEKYIKAYGSVVDMSREGAELRIWNEILADAYAGMNARGVDVAAYQEDVTQRVQKYTGESGQMQSNGVRQTNGPNSQAVENDEAEFALETGKIKESEIRDIQNIEGKSVSQFTNQDIQKTERLARRYWEEMGVKSPFFRAWFGDWRAHEKTPIQIANQRGSARGVQQNIDTGWNIQISGKVFDETKVHTDSSNKAARPYLDYINDIVKKAVLLDSGAIGKPKSHNSLLTHSLYAVADTGKGPEVLKLYVEEMNDPNQYATKKRAYQLQNVEKYRPTAWSLQNTAISGSAVRVGTIRSVSDLFNAVKQKDSKFAPNIVKSVVLNADGTPKVYYHRTDANWTTYDLEKNKNQMWGEGIYLTDDPERARLYGENVIPVYVQARYNNRDAKRLGVKRDHVFMKNTGDILVFSPTQIKSATSNIGTFDGNNPDIEYALGSEPVDTDVDFEERMRHYANVPEYTPGMESNGAVAEHPDVDEMLHFIFQIPLT